MRVSWRYPLVLLLVCLPMLVVVPAANAAPITATCNGGGCVGSWYKTNVALAFTWDPVGYVPPASQGCLGANVTSDGTFSYTCTVNYTGGGSASLPITVKRDATPPTVTGASLSRGPDSNGWYHSPVGVTFSGADPGSGSGLAGCTSASYGGPDTAGVTLSGTCSDQAGNVSAAATSPAIKYDATPPAIHASLSRGPDNGDWYNRPVDFTATATDNLSGSAGCTGGTVGGGGSGTATCRDNAGNVATAGVQIKYDSGPPSVDSATFDRPPDANGWYNHAVRVTFHGNDGGSGIGPCTDTTYSGPDTSNTTVNGTCRDNAGNTASGTSPAFKYDGTPPKISNVAADWDDGTATLTWAASPDTTSIEIDRAPGASGPDPSAVFKGGLVGRFEDTGLKNKVKYTYTINAFDEAGNKISDTVTIIPGAKLFSPARGAFVTSPPLLAWRAYPGATYYNLQVYYGVGKSLRQLASVTVSGRKVLSTWPVKPKYRMQKTWKYKGKKRGLSRGHYRWYVYPGLGKRKANKYGPLIGSSDFFVTKKR
jgi:hypothetical protein